MTPPGPRPSPANVVELRGNRGKRPLRKPPRLPSTAPPEPDWTKLLPGPKRDPVRTDARRAWKAVVPLLERVGILSEVDETVLIDFAICRARLWQCERLLSTQGLTSSTERGVAKNPLTTVAKQYRETLVRYIDQLGLGPASRGRIEVPKEVGLDAGADLID